MANDVSQQFTSDLQKTECYSMCLDECTDINNHTRLTIILHCAAGYNVREELAKLVFLPDEHTGWISTML